MFKRACSSYNLPFAEKPEMPTGIKENSRDKQVFP